MNLHQVSYKRNKSGLKTRKQLQYWAAMLISLTLMQWSFNILLYYFISWLLQELY